MREVWIDAWKGMLILLVVLGHVVGGGAHLCHEAGRTFCESAYRVIYLFHMPAFFALAGVCWKSPVEDCWGFLKKRARRLLLPYAVFGVVSAFVYVLMQQVFLSHAGTVTDHYASMGGEPWWQPFVSLLHAGGWPRGEGFRANSVLWFLPCMFSVEVVYAWLDRVFPRIGQQLVIAVCAIFASYSLRWWPGFSLPWGVSKLPWYIFFLIAGRWLLAPVFRSVQRSGWLYLSSLVLALGYIWVGQGIPDAFFVHVQLGGHVIWILISLVGCLISGLLALSFPSHALASCGMMSLAIMLVHKFPVLALQSQVHLTRNLFDGTVWECVGGVFLVAALAASVGMGAYLVLNRYCPWSMGVASHRK